MINLTPQAQNAINSGRLPVLDAVGTIVGFARTNDEAAHLLRDTYTLSQPDKLDMQIISMVRVPIESNVGIVEALWPVAAPVLDHASEKGPHLQPFASQGPRGSGRRRAATTRTRLQRRHSRRD